MDILPKILYIFQTIPIFPARNILNLLRKAIGGFIWVGKPVRISRAVLTRPKEDGGLALPDLSMYLRSVFVARIVDWFHNAECKQWVKLEEEIVAMKLKSLPWIKRKNRPSVEELPLLMASTLKVWDGLVRRGIGSTYIGPMTPLFSNPEFPPALEVMTFLKWQRRDDIRVVQIMKENGPPSIEDLGMEHKRKWMQCLQLQKFIISLMKGGKLDRSPTILERLFLQEQKPTHTLSNVYKYLMSENKDQEIGYIKKWEEELGIDIPRAKWKKHLY